MKKLLITGDSLSYNRYSYDESAYMNAQDCHIGMDSWSFRLRKIFISSAKGFKYGDELKFTEKTVFGMGEGIQEIDAFFGKRVATVTPENNLVHFEAESETGKIVIYFQKRHDNYCRFNISVDGSYTKTAIDTHGEDYEYQGYDILPIEIECDRSKKIHKVVLSDFEYTEKEPCVTVAGISTELKLANITGQGSRTMKFLLYHFEERIAKYSPDLLIIILGGNDCLFYSEDDYRTYLTEFFSLMSKQIPGCKIITITIPPSGKCMDEIRGIKIDSDDEMNNLLERYNIVLEELSKENGALCIRLIDVFKELSPVIWRYDNVHLSREGNDILFNEICKKLSLN